VKQIYANWRLKCGENRRLKLTVVGETGPNSKLRCHYYTVPVKLCCKLLNPVTVAPKQIMQNNTAN